jgi:4-amino-4-deoxy-L-arabinose transferase-like glycosyltransferase
MTAIALRIVHFLENTKHRVLLLFVTSLVMSIAFRLAAPDSRKTGFDADYAPQVTSLLAGRGFLTTDGHLLHRYPPAFPILLAGTYRAADIFSVDRSSMVFAVSAVFLATAAIIIFALARLFLAEWSAFVAAMVFASHPHMLYLLLAPMSETPFMVFFYGSLLALLKAVSNTNRDHPPQDAIVCGVLLGLAMLTRPIAVFLPLVFAMSMVVWGQPTRRARGLFCLLFLVTVSLIIAPWEAVVYNNTHEVVLLSSGAVQGMRDGLSFNNKAFRQKLELPREVERLSNDAWEQDRTFAAPRDVGKFLLDKLGRSPVAVAQLFALKAARAWFGTDSQDHNLELFNKLFLVVYMPVVGLGMFYYWRDRRGSVALAKVLLLVVAYFWGMAILVLSIARYMVPAVGLLLIFTAYPMQRCVRRLQGTVGAHA